MQEAYNDEHGITPQSIVKAIDEVMSSVYERDYMTPAATVDGTERFQTQAELDAHIAVAAGRDARGGRQPRLREGRDAARRDQAPAQPRAGLAAGRRGGPDRRVLPFIENWLKKAALEVQEYVRLVAAALRGVVHAAASTATTSSSSSTRSASGR